MQLLTSKEWNVIVKGLFVFTHRYFVAVSTAVTAVQMAVINGGIKGVLRIASLSLVNSWEMGVSPLGAGG